MSSQGGTCVQCGQRTGSWGQCGNPNCALSEHRIAARARKERTTFTKVLRGIAYGALTIALAVCIFGIGVTIHGRVRSNVQPAQPTLLYHPPGDPTTMGVAVAGEHVAQITIPTCRLPRGLSQTPDGRLIIQKGFFKPYPPCVEPEPDPGKAYNLTCPMGLGLLSDYAWDPNDYGK